MSMKFEAINLEDKFAKFTEHWSPRVIAELNDYQIKLVKIGGEFVWHDHPETDEMFFVIEGRLKIEFRDGSVVLECGELFVVPKGVEHKPVAESECKIMLIEPKGIINTGAVGGGLTAQNNKWI
jgi:mannose-6-phosphate isomerase-like protein (cupin superfamily)